MTRQRRAAGSKRDLGDGRWRLYVSVGFDPMTGKRRRESEIYYGDERGAELRLAQMLAKSGRHSSTSMTLWAFIETMYLPAIQPPVLRRLTVKGYADKLEKYVKPTIGDIKMDKLTAYTMVSWMRSVKSTVPNKQSQLHIYRALSAVLTKAVAWDILPENLLTRAVDAPEPDEYVPTVLTAEQANDYLDAFAGHQLEPVVVLALSGGFRPSEIYAVEWADIDFETSTVTIDKGMHQLKSDTWLEDAKSRRSHRRVKLPQWAMESLRPYRGIGRVCGDLTPSQVTYRYKKHVTDSGLEPWCPLENLRHSHATINVEAGVAWEDMANRLGHSSMRMVRERYVKRWESRDDAVAGVVDSMRRKPLDGKREAK